MSIKITHPRVDGWQPAIRGMRNPKDSWHLSDSEYYYDPKTQSVGCNVGPEDLKLMKKLHTGGPVHSKYKRMLHITMDIDAPLYWWKEFDTYKVATVRNSCSTMHKIECYEFTRDMFSHEHLCEEALELLDATIAFLNKMRTKYLYMKECNDKHRNETADENTPKFTTPEMKAVWWQLIQGLPSTFNQKATVDYNYENASSMWMWRWNHKQDEWLELMCVLENLPYAHDIIKPARFDENTANPSIMLAERYDENSSVDIDDLLRRLYEDCESEIVGIDD